SVAHNEHFQYAGLVGEDRATLQQFIEGLMAVDEVVYVVITSSDGNILAQNTKGARQSSANFVRSMDQPLYPDRQIAKPLFQIQPTTPLMTRLPSSNLGSTGFAWEEIIYDFAMPVLRMPKELITPSSLALHLDDGRADSSRTQATLVSGVVQIGLSDAGLKHELTGMVWKSLFITLSIIGAGALGVYVLALRITQPLMRLSGAARQVAEGHSPVALTSSGQDEIGQLTNVFNLMARSIQERNGAIAANMATIKQQVSQLTTLHE